MEAPTEIVTKRKLQELVQQIDGREKLDDEVEEVILIYNILII